MRKLGVEGEFEVAGTRCGFFYGISFENIELRSREKCFRKLTNGNGTEKMS